MAPPAAAPAPAVDLPYAEVNAAFKKALAAGATLGKGGAGAVVKAKLAAWGEVVAIKQLNPDKPGMLEREWTAAPSVARQNLKPPLLGHPNLLPLLGKAEAEGGDRYLVYPVLQCDLDSALRRERTARDFLDADSRLRIAVNIAAGLRALHLVPGPDVAHRDVKPLNVLLHTVDGRLTAVLADFGIAKELHGETHASTAHYGTERYADTHPSRSGLQRSNGRARMHLRKAFDIYSLGVLLRELLEACPAFYASKEWSVDLKHGHFQDWLRFAPGADDPYPFIGWAKETRTALHALAQRCMGKPERRPTADQVLEALSALAAGAKCVACLRDARAAAFLPCGHWCACERCAAAAARLAPPRCPLCSCAVGGAAGAAEAPAYVKPEELGAAAWAHQPGWGRPSAAPPRSSLIPGGGGGAAGGTWLPSWSAAATGNARSTAMYATAGDGGGAAAAADSDPGFKVWAEAQSAIYKGLGDAFACQCECGCTRTKRRGEEWQVVAPVTDQEAHRFTRADCHSWFPQALRGDETEDVQPCYALRNTRAAYFVVCGECARCFSDKEAGGACLHVCFGKSTKAGRRSSGASGSDAASPAEAARQGLRRVVQTAVNAAEALGSRIRDREPSVDDAPRPAGNKRGRGEETTMTRQQSTAATPAAKRTKWKDQ